MLMNWGKEYYTNMLLILSFDQFEFGVHIQVYIFKHKSSNRAKHEKCIKEYC